MGTGAVVSTGQRMGSSGWAYRVDTLGVLSVAAPSLLAAGVAVASSSALSARRRFFRSFPGLLMDVVDLARLRLERGGGERGAADVCAEWVVGMSVVGDEWRGSETRCTAVVTV